MFKARTFESCESKTNFKIFDVISLSFYVPNYTLFFCLSIIIAFAMHVYISRYLRHIYRYIIKTIYLKTKIINTLK